MAEVKVLIKGYAKEIENGWIANSTVTLIKDNGKKIIVDPGVHRGKLIEALEKEGLSLEDIDYVVISHGHTDHCILAGAFPNAKILNNYEIYDNDEQLEHNNKIPNINLEILQTPGHAEDHCSVVVNTDKGVCVVAGDVFWWKDDEEQIVNINKEEVVHPGNMIQLVESRKKVLEIADFIIPGHGEMFEVEK